MAGTSRDTRSATPSGVARRSALGRKDYSGLRDAPAEFPATLSQRRDMKGFARIDAVIAAIARGGVVGIPTDTVYGLACDPSSDIAVERIYEIKARPAGL